MINKYDNVNQTYSHMINNNISITDEDRQFTIIQGHMIPMAGRVDWLRWWAKVPTFT